MLNHQALFLQYEDLHRLHPAWPPSELRRMTYREREYWRAMGRYRIETFKEGTK